MKIRDYILSQYAVAIISVAVALVITLTLQPLLNQTVFILFCAAIVVSTWYGGIQPAIVSTVLSTIAINYFLIQPKLSLQIQNLDNLVALSLFIFVTTLISVLNLELRIAKQKLEENVQSLRESESKFEKLKQANIIGIILTEIKGKLLAANQAFLNMIGYTQEELQSGKLNWSLITPQEKLEKNDYLIREIQTQGVYPAKEREYVNQDRSTTNLLVGLAELDHKPEHLIGVAVEVSDDCQREENFPEQPQERFNFITNCLPMCVGYFDHQQYYRFNNQQYEEWFGVSTAKIYGQHLKEFLSETVYQKIVQYLEIALSGQKVNYETQFADQKDRDHHVDITYIPQTNQQGEIEGIVEIIRDITEQKQSEQERETIFKQEKTARIEAQTTNRIKDEFLGTLSHELRTPLNAILGWTQLLKSRDFDQKTIDNGLDTIDRNSQLLAKLVDDVLDVSRIISGKLRLHLRPVELMPIITIAIDTVHHAAEEKNIDINLEADPSVGIMVVDVDRLQQVIGNLLTNAIKFTPEQGKIAVKVKRIDGNVQIQVIDTGVGIAPEFLPYVFERFRQADKSSTRSQSGLGLGLAIVRYLVEQHGGSVAATSDGLDQGSTFMITLPIQSVVKGNHQPKPSETENQTEAKLSSLQDIKILVVDDEADARHILKITLEEYEAEVRTADSVNAALSILDQFHPDILVSDIGMPEEDGYDLIRKIRSLPSDKGGKIPAVALTGYARAEERTQALLAGFQLHISKPVNSEELVAAVVNLAGRT